MVKLSCTCRKVGRGPYKGWKQRRRRARRGRRGKGFFGLGLIPV